jgi:hypothetical protein
MQNILSSLLSKIYKIVILPVVLYGRETSSLTLREEQSLKVLPCFYLSVVVCNFHDENRL